MKRFHWRLQRLLDVTVQRERAVRLELLALSREMARVRQGIAARRAAVRGLLAELKLLPTDQQLTRQQLVMAQHQADQRRMNRLLAELAELESRRRERTAAYLELRARRQGLERMRQRAQDEHQRQQLRQDQKLLDESAHNAAARLRHELDRRRRGAADGHVSVPWSER